MVSLLLIVWFLAWTPYALMCLWIMFFNARGLSPVIGLIPLLACKTSAGANAMLYGMRYTSSYCRIKPLTQFFYMYRIFNKVIDRNVIILIGCQNLKPK